MERVVLFGAGASYGAEHVLPDVPPLGKNLYGELCRRFPDNWNAVPKAVREAF